MVKTNLSNSNKLNNSQCLKNLKDTIVSSSTLNTDSNKKDVENHPLIIYHQNIRGLKDKIEESVISIASESPHFICLSEHHLKYNEIDAVNIPNYRLGGKYCRSSIKCGGVSIYIHKDMEYSNINLFKYCKEQDLEIVAVKLKLVAKNLIVFCA